MHCRDVTTVILISNNNYVYSDQQDQVTAYDAVPYNGKLSNEKTFTNFVVLEPPVKVFSTKFGRAVPTYDRF